MAGTFERLRRNLTEWIRRGFKPPPPPRRPPFVFIPVRDINDWR